MSYHISVCLCSRQSHREVRVGQTKESNHACIAHGICQPQASVRIIPGRGDCEHVRVIMSSSEQHRRDLGPPMPSTSAIKRSYSILSIALKWPERQPGASSFLEGIFCIVEALTSHKKNYYSKKIKRQARRSDSWRFAFSSGRNSGGERHGHVIFCATFGLEERSRVPKSQDPDPF